jgi:subtilisin family serine protease
MGQYDHRLSYRLRKRRRSAFAGEIERVLLHFGPTEEEKGDVSLAYILSRIEREGFKKTSVLGDIAAGEINLENLERITAHHNVISIEGSASLKGELDLSTRDIGLVALSNLHKELGAKMQTSKEESGAGMPTGKGVVIGVIDSGFDVLHPCFQEANGKRTRIIAFWDQNQDIKDIAPPDSFDYGVEYTSQHINKALNSANPESIVPRNSENLFHGTHVAAIAAGNGAVPQGSTVKEGTFTGIAPDAELVLVSYINRGHGRLSGSAYVVDAIRYILDKAGGKPVVINFSQGSNIGTHDGTSLLEKAIDNILGKPSVAFVNSAGNARDDRTHFGGQQVRQGDTRELKISVEENDIGEDTIDIWYGPKDKFDVAVYSPSGQKTPQVMPASTVSYELDNGNEVYIRSRICDPENGANRIVVILNRGKKGRIEPGEWIIALTGRDIESGVFHAWIDNTKEESFPRFVMPRNQFTVTIPGTSKEVITVGAYYTRQPDQKLMGENPLPPIGSLVEFSSNGPIVELRDKKMTTSPVFKPDLVAPGSRIKSAVDSKALIADDNGDRHTDGYALMDGTSQAAPHVTGAIALLFERKPTLTQDEVKEILTSSTTKDGFTGLTPNNLWGHGKLNIKAAIEALSKKNS